MARPMPRDAPVIRTARPLIRSCPARRPWRAAGRDRGLGPVVRREGPSDDLAVDPDPSRHRLGLAGLPAPDRSVRLQTGLVVPADIGDEVGDLGEAETRSPLDRLGILSLDAPQRNAGVAIRAGQGD